MFCTKCLVSGLKYHGLKLGLSNNRSASQLDCKISVRLCLPRVLTHRLDVPAVLIQSDSVRLLNWPLWKMFFGGMFGMSVCWRCVSSVLFFCVTLMAIKEQFLFIAEWNDKLRVSEVLLCVSRHAKSFRSSGSTLSEQSVTGYELKSRISMDCVW